MTDSVDQVEYMVKQFLIRCWRRVWRLSTSFI